MDTDASVIQGARASAVYVTSVIDLICLEQFVGLAGKVKHWDGYLCRTINISWMIDH